MVLAVLAGSCSKKAAEYTNVIPAEATEVAAVRLDVLAEKAGAKEKENQAALQGLLEELKTSLTAAAYQELEKVVKEPKASGIDVEAPVYVFRTPDFRGVTMVAKVKSEDRLRDFIEATQQEWMETELMEGDGLSYGGVNSRAMLGFNASALVVMVSGWELAPEQGKAQLAAWMNQAPEACFTSTKAFARLQKLTGDVKAMLDPQGLMGRHARNLQVPQGVDLKDLRLLCALNFEKGKIVLEVENYTENEELKGLLEQQAKAVKPIENRFVKYFPKSTVALLSLGVDGKELYRLLEANERLGNEVPIIKSPEVKAVMESLEDDVTLGLVNVTLRRDPAVMLYAGVKSDEPLKQLYERKSELGMRPREDIVKLSENDYVYKIGRTNFFFGIRDKQLYVTNDEMLYRGIGKAADPSVKETNYASGLKGLCGAAVVNVEEVVELPVMKMVAGLGGPKMLAIYNLAQEVSYVKADTDGRKGSLTVQLKQKDVNALKQAAELAKRYLTELTGD